MNQGCVSGKVTKDFDDSGYITDFTDGSTIFTGKQTIEYNEKTVSEDTITLKPV